MLDLGMAYSMKYLIEGITGVENNSWNLYYGNAYHSQTACIIGPSLEGDGIFEVTITGSPGLMPKKIFEEFTTASPKAKHFKNAKLIKKNGCGLKPFMAMKEPCRGNVMAIGDCAAMVEVETQGGLLCGYHAGNAVADELDGKKGFEAYVKWWNDAFEFNCDDPMEQLKLYGALSIKRTLADDEIDYLFSMLADEKHCGHFNQYEVPKNFWTDVLKHNEEIRKDRPALFDKLAAIRTFKEQGKF